MIARGWTCRRVKNRLQCNHRNPPGTRKCEACGKPRPARRRKAHMVALTIDYAGYIELNGGVELCGICRRPPTTRRRLDRDHDHITHRPRGLLCRPCNRVLVAQRYGVKMTPAWLRSAADYLDRAKGTG